MLGDRDGDGKPEVVAALNKRQPGSAADVKVILRIFQSAGGFQDVKLGDAAIASGWNVNTLAALGDRDGDGKEEIIAGFASADRSEGKLRLYYSSKGTTEELLHGKFMVSAAAPIGDRDGDGKQEIIAGLNRPADKKGDDAAVCKIYGSKGTKPKDISIDKSFAVDVLATRSRIP